MALASALPSLSPRRAVLRKSKGHPNPGSMKSNCYLLDPCEIAIFFSLNKVEYAWGQTCVGLRAGILF